MSTNFDSSFHTSQLAHPLLKASGKGSIVFISSVAGGHAVCSGSIYAASKGNQIYSLLNFKASILLCWLIVNCYLLGAINQLAKYFGCEWAKDNIRVNSVLPWYTKTSLVEEVSFKQTSHLL